MSIRLILAIGCLVIGPASAAAQTSSPRPFSIQVTEEATVAVKPDEVQIDVGVTTKAPASEAAADRNAQLAKAVTDAVRAGIGSNASIETVGYTLTPDLRYPREGGEPTIAGYTASNTVRVTMQDVSRVGEIIDLAAKAGANQIRRIDFRLHDDRTARAEALREAATRARTRAEMLASALGVRIVRVLSAVSGGEPPPVRPFDARFTAEAATAATPIHPGTIDVHATVTLSVEIADSSQTG